MRWRFAVADRLHCRVSALDSMLVAEFNLYLAFAVWEHENRER